MINNRIPRVCAAIGLVSGTALAALLGSGAVALADGTQANAPQQITLQAAEFGYTPNSVQLTVGQPVQLTIVNGGLLDHDMKSDIPISQLVYQQADNDPDEQQSNAAQGVLDVDFNKGDTSVITFVPTTAGTYAFTCDQPGHTEAGMAGSFVVTGG